MTQEYWFEEGCFITELSNTPDDPAVSLEGRGRAQVGDAPPREVGPGDMVFIPPDCRQRVASIGSGDLVFLAICTPRFVKEACETLEG